MAKAKVNNKVKVHYKGTLSDGKQFDSSEGREPLEFIIGKGLVIKGFDKGIEGMEENEQKTINIPAAEAYGEIRKELIHQIPKNTLPENIKPELGMKLVSRMDDGTEIPIIVTDVSEETITIDANHPLAGQDLTFEVKLVEIVS